MDGLKELAMNEFEDTEDDEEKEDLTVSITDFEDIPDDYANEKDCWDFAEAFAECDQEIEVVGAALSLGIEAKDIDEAYQGSYRDDEDFAQEMASSLGLLDKNARWQQNCIDWEQAAKQLMYDYSEE